MNSRLDQLREQTISVEIEEMGRVQAVLKDVEYGGVWLEGNQLLNRAKHLFKVETAPEALVVFVPFHRIKILCGHAFTPPTV